MDLCEFYKKLVIRQHSYFTNQICDLHEYTENFDYDCRFKEGICKKYNSAKAPNPRCCCSGCATHSGYMHAHHPRMILAHMETFARLFKEDVGYWREGEGCALPRKLRSPICLQHRCVDEYTALIKLESQFTTALSNHRYYEAEEIMDIHKRLLNENKNKNKV